MSAVAPSARSAASWRLVWPTWDPTTTRPCPPPARGRICWPRSGAPGARPPRARTNEGPVRNKNDWPPRSASSTPAATVSRSEYSVALTTTHLPPCTPASSSPTRDGPPPLVGELLAGVHGGRWVVVNATEYSDLETSPR